MARLLSFIVTVVFIAGVRMSSCAPPPESIRLASVSVPQSAEARGRLAYAKYGCGLCHGERGTGGFPNPNAQTDGKVPGVIYVAEGYTTTELRRLLLDGRTTISRANPKGPHPPYRMPGWREQMTDAELDDLVRYLISLQPKSTEESWR